MGKSRTDNGRVIDEAFRREAVRILGSGGVRPMLWPTTRRP